MNRSVLAGAVIVGLVISGISAYGLYLWSPWSAGASRSVTIAIPDRDIAPPGAPPVVPVAYQPITAATAEEINKAVPLQPVGPSAVPLRVAEGTLTWDRAARCLAQAIYYEAGAEAPDGQRAVAQVVLNRVRSPAFPNSVCGVIYQGSERATGCQFTFTCDGSLRRQPSVAGWQRAMGVAIAALRGSVYAPVGNATHYHADYVVPYWAPGMAKISTIGAHIFYRWPGTWRTATYFSQRYANVEPDLTVPPGLVPGSVTLVALAAADNMAVLSATLVPPTAAPAKPVSALAADQKPYTLIAGEKASTLDPRLNRPVVLAADAQGAKLTPTPR
ncbi:hypothetical protein BH11PSE5_BH11PSE5_10740 [soil metagenome]